MSDPAGAMHRGLYAKSDKANARENQNLEFLTGYATGAAREHIKFETGTLISLEWERRGKPERLCSGFREWKRGLQAARMQIACMVKA